MRSKLMTVLIAGVGLLSLSACTGLKSDPNKKNNYMIGEKVGAASAMSDRVGGERTRIALFDKTTRLIHEFDLTTMAVVRTIEVDHPEASHSVLFDQSSDLIVDLGDGHVTLYDRDGGKNVDPVEMSDKAKSAAFNPLLGLLVIYDEMGSVGLIKLDTNGQVVDKWTGGPLVSGTQSLKSGDLMGDGKLVLALENGVLARIDVAAVIAAKSWGVVPTVTTAMGTMKWLAPVRGHDDLVLALNETTIALVSLTTGATLSSRPIATGEHVAEQSKSVDAHIILKNGYQTVIVYTDGVSVLSKAANVDSAQVDSSRLCLTQDTWTFIDSKVDVSWTNFQQEVEYSGRTLKKYRLTDLHASPKKDLPDSAQLDISEKYVFALFPDQLGHGVRMGISDSSEAAIDGFNMGYIHR